MNVYVCYFVFASSAYLVNATDIPDDLYLLLPFIQSQPPPPCPLNELYKSCFGNCSDCNRRGSCLLTTCIEGCDCAPQFYRITPGGPCVPVAKCPIPKCGENEVFRECGPICERCKTLKCQVISCDHKCYCKEGYLRDEDGTCIPEEECPKREKCSRTEEWSDRGPVNEFCLHSENATSVSEIQELSQCYCKEGHKRSNLGHCVEETRCSRIKCLGKEVFHNCVPKCNTTCRNQGEANCVEDVNCYPGCFCPTGYYMNDFRQCVTVEECPTDMMHMLVDEPDGTTEQVESTEIKNFTTILPDEIVSDSEMNPEYTTNIYFENTSSSTNDSSPESLIITESSVSTSAETPDTSKNSTDLSHAHGVAEAIRSATTEATLSDEYDFDNENI